MAARTPSRLLAIIPARGGSKGLPGKNLRPCAGKPLIAHTILAARAAAEISRVIVSTEDADIARTAREWGADVPFMRPLALASDHARTADVCVHVLDELQAREGQRLETFVLLQPTSPLRRAEDIDAAVRLWRDTGADSVVSVCAASKPPLWAYALRDDGRLTPYIPYHFPQVTDWPDRPAQRQTVPAAYVPNGAIYVVPAALIRQGRYTTDATRAFLMPEDRSVDVDTALDLAWAEFLMERSAGRTADDPVRP